MKSLVSKRELHVLPRGFAAGLLIISALTFEVAAENTLYGTNAGASITAGDHNVLLGESAGASIGTRSENVFVGAEAGQAVLYSGEGVIFGYQAASQDQSIYGITAIGTRAGLNNTNSYNTLFGFEAGQNASNQRGLAIAGSSAGYANDGTNASPYNSFLGYRAAYNISGNFNVAIGSESLYGNVSDALPTETVAFGFRAAYGIGSSEGNVAVGEGAGYFLGDGTYNTLVGARAGENVQDNSYPTSEEASTMVGTLSGLESASGAKSNTFFGAAAGANNQTGDGNVVIGAFADFTDWSQLTEAQVETIFKSASGTATGLTPSSSNISNGTLIGSYGNISADFALAVGYNVNASGTGSVVIGAGANATHTKSIVIGYGASSHGDNIAVIGNNSTTGWHPHADGVTTLGRTDYRFTNLFSQSLTTIADSGSSAALTIAADAASDAGDSWQVVVADNGNFSFNNDISGSQSTLISLRNDGGLTVTGDVNVLSDANFKKNIVPIDDARNLINQLRPVSYIWRPQTFRDERQHSGLIAQEVETILPETVSTRSDGMKSINYVALLPVLAQAGGELNVKQNQQQQQLDSLDERLDAIEAALVIKRN
ncbi:tail fiber domain-containing protein [Aliikangiella coralliicola]|uniref:Peptidase S74 domain-containing protein n=1 Tax=Aliikangiella coralliicola TaxID=2592383 RepID=A0A545UFA6_9GAMM|nr:tail fiber domain-containing protein [Aliikangiella coralliicola]TQV88073.1 hypothetical protein FLL46_09705 [Aliikangiella coralliicola]